MSEGERRHWRQSNGHWSGPVPVVGQVLEDIKGMDRDARELGRDLVIESIKVEFVYNPISLCDTLYVGGVSRERGDS